MSLEKEYLDIVQNILDSDEFQKEKNIDIMKMNQFMNIV